MSEAEWQAMWRDPDDDAEFMESLRQREVVNNLGHDTGDLAEVHMAVDRVESIVGPRIVEGTAILRALRNDQVWIDAGGRVWSLEEMTISHRANALRFIRKRVRHLAVLAWWGYLGDVSGLDSENMGDMAFLATSAHVEQQMHMCENKPEEWLNSTPLVRRLAALVEADEVEADRRDARAVQRRDRRTWADA